MRVAVYYNNKDIRLEEMPTPSINSGELLVKVKASGICGSDVMEWYRIKKAPLVLGHEITGEVVESKDDRYKIGDRVFVSHHVPCNTCKYCLNGHHTACETLHKTNFYPGGFAEYIRVPSINVDRGVYVLPEAISFEDGTFIEPLACVLRGQRLAGIKPGDTVLVIGSGISGILHIQLAKALEAGKIISSDVNEYRLNFAKRFGAEAVHADELLGYVKKEGLADKVIVCTGAAKAFSQALECVDRGGRVLFFATTEAGVKIPVDVEKLWRNEVTVLTSYGAAPKDIEKSIELLRAKRVNVKDMITHRLGLEETGLGFKLVAEAKDSLKVIIEPCR